MTPPPKRAERKDATANRERLLVAAESYLAEHGLDAPLQGLANAAGVGIGTLYRHFPSRDDLIRALYDRIGTRLDLVAVRVARAPTGWTMVEAFVDGVVDVALNVPLMQPVIHRMAQIDPEYRPGRRFEAPVAALVERAQEEGALRPDVTGTDLALIPHLLAGVRALPEPARTMVLARQRALLLDGLRADAVPRAPLPGTPRSVDEHHDAMHGRDAGH